MIAAVLIITFFAVYVFVGAFVAGLLTSATFDRRGIAAFWPIYLLFAAGYSIGAWGYRIGERRRRMKSKRLIGRSVRLLKTINHQAAGTACIVVDVWNETFVLRMLDAPPPKSANPYSKLDTSYEMGDVKREDFEVDERLEAYLEGPASQSDDPYRLPGLKKDPPSTQGVEHA